MDPITLLELTTGAVTAGKTILGFKEAEAQKNLLRQQEVENRLAATEKENQRGNKLQKILGAQIAKVGASGVTLDSGSFKAVQTESINEAAQDQHLQQLQADITETNLKQKENDVENAAMFNAFNNIFEATTSLSGISEQKKKLNIFSPTEEQNG
jgi:hypothetical protein